MDDCKWRQCLSNILGLPALPDYGGKSTEWKKNLLTFVTILCLPSESWGKHTTAIQFIATVSKIASRKCLKWMIWNLQKNRNEFVMQKYVDGLTL